MCLTRFGGCAGPLSGEACQSHEKHPARKVILQGTLRWGVGSESLALKRMGPRDCLEQCQIAHEPAKFAPLAMTMTTAGNGMQEGCERHMNMHIEKSTEEKMHEV